jgi:hypothetical protein
MQNLSGRSYEKAKKSGNELWILSSYNMTAQNLEYWPSIFILNVHLESKKKYFCPLKYRALCPLKSLRNNINKR